MTEASQGAFGKVPHGKRDGSPIMNIPTLTWIPPFEGDSYVFPTHKRELCQELGNVVNPPCACSSIPSKKKCTSFTPVKRNQSWPPTSLGVRHNLLFSVQKMGSPPPAPNQKMPMKFLASKHYMIITSDQLLRFSPPNSAYKVAPCSTETTLPWITCDMTLIIILRNFGVRKERNLSCLESTDEIVPNLDSVSPLTEERRNDGIVGSPCVSTGGSGAG